MEAYVSQELGVFHHAMERERSSFAGIIHFILAPVGWLGTKTHDIYLVYQFPYKFLQHYNCENQYMRTTAGKEQVVCSDAKVNI
uniref:Uncharacterized protein n=1 Tax=Arundo donax TaxID=35708 RepID=A0A0A9G6F1_ARUDO